MVEKILPYTSYVLPATRANCAPVRPVRCAKIRILRLSYFLETGAAEQTNKRNLASALRKIIGSNKKTLLKFRKNKPSKRFFIDRFFLFLRRILIKNKSEISAVKFLVKSFKPPLFL